MTTKSESEISQEPTLAQAAFVERVNRLIECGPVLLAKRFDRGQRRRTQYLFPRLSASISVGNSPDCVHPNLNWTDTSCGKSGLGAISLAAHVWKVSEYESARRIYEFVRIETGDYYFKDGLRRLAELDHELAA